MLAYALGYLSNVRFAQAITAGQILLLLLVRPLLAMSKLMDNHTDDGPDNSEAHHPI